MKKLYILIALIASAVVNVYAQDSPIAGGYSMSSYLSDSGNVYWAGTFGGHSGSVSSNTYTKVPVLSTVQLGNTTGFLNKIRSISANAGNTILALACDSTVYVWAGGGFGQNGDGTINGADYTTGAGHVLTGAQGSASGFLNKVVYVSTENESSLALLSNGQVMAWGRNDLGQCGNGTTTTPITTPGYVLTAAGTPLTNVIQIAGGENNGIALKSDGTVWVWGSDGNNQTGVCGGANALYAIQVAGLPQIVKIASGDFNFFALGVDGYLWAWGRGSAYAGMLALASGNGSDICIPERVAAVGSTTPTTQYLTGVEEFDAGQTAVVCRMSDGSVVGWGSGIGGGSVPQYILNPAGTANLSNIAFVGCGDKFAMAMATDGTLYTWGSNSSGDLGYASGGSTSLPTAVSPKPYKAFWNCPYAYLGSDLTLCNPSSATLYAGSTSATYKYRWYLNGTLITDSAANYATGAYLTVNAPGTYKVVITDTSALRLKFICPCPPVSDQVVITTSGVAPINATFCAPPSKSVTLAVNDPGSTFDWYAASTGGSALATGTNTYTTPLISTTTTYYVQDTRTYTYTTGFSMGSPIGTSSQGLSGWGSQYNTNTLMHFNVLSTLTLISVDIDASDSPASAARQLNLLDSASGAILQTATYTFGGSGVQTFPLNWTIAPGKYTLKWNAGFFNPYYYSAGAVYPIGISGLISLYGTTTLGTNNKSSSGFFNWKVSAPSNCGRIPVQATLTSTCPLPVNFLSFEAEKINGNVHLSWTTAELGGNQFFEIERSADGIKFDAVGKVEAKTGSYSSYSFDDQSVPSGILYYRIKQFDKDGSFMYSEIRSVADLLLHEVTVFPNPSENNFNLSVSGFICSDFKGEIYNSIGTKVETINGTTNKDILFGNTLPSGCYLLKLVIGNDAPKVLKICKL
jgi:alpha-tubulin suppressor-like RCC1 family protein